MLSSINGSKLAAESASTVIFDKAQVDEYQKIVISDIKSGAAHDNWKREFIRDSWRWHLWSTGLIFVIVMGIVIFGLYITYLQFKRDYRAWDVQLPAADKSDVQPDDKSRPPSASVGTLKISATGLEVSSQIIGLLVLAFSLAFFYLYVKVVYPMQTEELTQLQKATGSEQSSDKAAPVEAPKK